MSNSSMTQENVPTQTVKTIRLVDAGSGRYALPRRSAAGAVKSTLAMLDVARQQVVSIRIVDNGDGTYSF